MASIVQAPAALSLGGVAGNPFSVTFDVTLTGAVWSDVNTITASVIGIKNGYTAQVQADALIPTITSSTNTITLTWSAAQTAAFVGWHQLAWSLSFEIASAGPYTVASGPITMSPETTPGAYTSTTANLAVTVGGTTVDLAVTLGGGGGGGWDYTGSGSPQGIVSAAAIGDTYKDTANGGAYIALATGNSNWAQLGGGYGGSIIQGYVLGEGGVLVGDGALYVLPAPNSNYSQFSGNDAHWPSTVFTGPIAVGDGGAGTFLYSGTGDPNTYDFSNYRAPVGNDYYFQTDAEAVWKYNGSAWVCSTRTMTLNIYNGDTWVPYSVPCSSVPPTWNGTGTATFQAQFTVGTNFPSGFYLDAYSNPIPDGWNFTAFVFVGGTYVYDIIALNAYAYGPGGILAWNQGGGPAAMLNVRPGGASTQLVVNGHEWDFNNDGSLSLPGGVTAGALPTSDPHSAGAFWNNGGVVNVSAG